MKECPNCYLCFDDEANLCPHDEEVLITTNKCKTTISRYVLEKKLGKGGMGSVYRAKHKFLKTAYAVKIISPEVVREDAGLLVRFRQEAILAASIHHPNVVAVTDYGVENDTTPYLVMEYIEGISLDDYLRKEKQLSPLKAFEILAPIALGVAEAHGKGIIHRDLKPLNIMLRNGYPLSQAVKVLDFGLAKIKSSESFASLIQAKTNNLLGSPHYMPPEQWANEDIDARSDVYSLGVILFQMLTGSVPFRGESIVNIMYQHLQIPTPALASFGISVSPQIEAVIQKALAKQQAERFASVEEFLSEYEKALLITSSRFSKTADDQTVSFFDSSLYRVSRIPIQEDPKATGENFGNTYNLAYLTPAQNQTLTDFFAGAKQSERGTEKLQQEFLYAQTRVEEARTKVSEAEKLALEFDRAQKAAEDARQKVLLAQQKLEEDMRRVQAEMESKLAAEREAREKAEAEASRLTEEAKKRKQAEERARQMAEAALKAQQRAEIEHENAEKEIQQRQLEEGTRRKAEQAALKLAAEVAEAKRKYEEAKREAEAEAHFRAEAELKQKEIEAEVERIARLEAEKRRIAEAQAAEQIKQQESLLKQQALEAQQKTEEARRLAESEAEKRQQAEAARIKAEEEARRLAEEIIKAQQQLEEAQRFAKSESEKRAVEKAARIKAEESARSLSALRESAGNFDKKHSSEISVENAVNDLAPVSRGETVAISSKPSLGRMLLNTSSSDVSNTNQIPRNKIFNPLILAAGAFALFLVSGFGGFLIYQLTKSSNIESASVNSNIAVSPTQTTPQLPARVRGKMVLIEGGTFLMGNNDVDLENYVFNNQYPAHTVKVPDFYIDITEVTNEEYNEFVQSGNKPPRNWQDGKPPTGQEKFPVTNISYLEAEKFADWISKRNNIICRLPAEEEWEYAARSGKEQNTYPWGKDWDPGRVNINSKTPREVGTTGDETNIGKVKDMMGNVVEWTSTAYNFYENFPKYKAYPFDPKKFTVRGASFASSPDQIKNHRFLLTFRQGVEDTNASPTLGFRLACYP